MTRPWWMTALLAFCAFMALARVPWDVLTTPVAADQEVWFGILFTGAVAKGLGVTHWLVYAAGAWGLWRMSPWLWPWAAVYAAQVAFSAALWPFLYRGSARGLVPAAAFAFIAVQLWRARPLLKRCQAPFQQLRRRGPSRRARSAWGRGGPSA